MKRCIVAVSLALSLALIAGLRAADDEKTNQTDKPAAKPVQPASGVRTGFQPGPGAGVPDYQKELIPALLEALNDDDEQVREAAGTALSSLGRTALSPLMDALKGTDKKKRVQAAKLLGQMGPAAQEAIPVLTKGLKDEDKEFRRAAAIALSNLVRNSPGMMMGYGPPGGGFGGPGGGFGGPPPGGFGPPPGGGFRGPEGFGTPPGGLQRPAPGTTPRKPTDSDKSDKKEDKK